MLFREVPVTEYVWLHRYYRWRTAGRDCRVVVERLTKDEVTFHEVFWKHENKGWRGPSETVSREAFQQSAHFLVDYIP